MRHDLFNNVKVVNALDVQTISSNTTTAGDIIDTAGFESAVFGIHTGTVTDGDYAILLEHGDNSSLTDAVAVPDADLIGTEAGASFTADGDDNKVSKVGYIGIKRYVRMSIVSANTSSGAVVGGYCILGNPHNAPQSSQVN